MLRELLTASSGALITYGIGTAGLWEQVTGGILALAMLVWAIRTNEGKEQWFTLARKLLSAVGGTLMAMGVTTPDKINILLGVASSALAMGWTIFKLPPPSANEAGPPA